jgi:hypothetical protein
MGPLQAIAPGPAQAIVLNARWDYDVDYTDELTDEPAAPHLAQGSDNDELLARGLWWELLAVSAVLRDRWFIGAIRGAMDC